MPTPMQTTVHLHVGIIRDESGEYAAVVRIGDDLLGSYAGSADDAFHGVLSQITIPEPDSEPITDPDAILDELRKAEANDSVVRIGLIEDVAHFGQEYLMAGEHDVRVQQVHEDDSITVVREDGETVPLNAVSGRYNQIEFVLPV